MNTTQEESGSEVSGDEDSLEGGEALSLSLSLRAELQQQVVICHLCLARSGCHCVKKKSTSYLCVCVLTAEV